MASTSRILYTGVTNDLPRRVAELKAGRLLGFTQKYRVNRLVYFETTHDVRVAIEREKELKRWRRSKKVELIEKGNPEWNDLSWQGEKPEDGENSERL